MSSDLSAEVTAIATAVLAAFAFVTAILAGLAFWKQSREVRDQAKMLNLESEELAEQRKLNAEQAKVFELQASDLRESLEERRREAAERHQAQARLIAATFGGGTDLRGPGRTEIELINGSLEPVYRLVVTIVGIQGAGSPSTIEGWLERRDREREKHLRGRAPAPITTASILPSGRYLVWIDGIWGPGTGESHGVEVAFTDRAGSHWIRRATGQLEELELAEDPIAHYLGEGPHDLQMPKRVT